MNRTLEVALGLGAAYLFLSVIVLALIEGISGFLNRRGAALGQALEGMLTKGVATELFKHPLVQTLGSAAGRDGKSMPSYLGPTMFSQAMTDLITQGKHAEGKLDEGYQDFLRQLDGKTRTHVEKIVGEKIQSAEELKQRLEDWFNASMDRLSGAYKRNTQWIARGFAVALVIGLNVNTINMARTLWNDPEARAAAVLIAKRQVDQCETGATAKPGPADGHPPVDGGPVTPPTPPVTQATGTNCESLITATTDEIPFPIAGRFWDGLGSHPARTIFGLLLSIWAVSLGAPFWFDLMRKISNGIQATGPKPPRNDTKK